MQKVFDVDNKEDMDLLWSILPDDIVRIGKNVTDFVVYWRKGEEYPIVLNELNIDLHDKTEITRPVNYEDMIGCVGWFGNCDKGKAYLGILKDVTPTLVWDNLGRSYLSFTPAKKSELKFWGEQDE